MQGKHYYQGFNPKIPSQLSKQPKGSEDTNNSNSRNEENNFSKEEFLEYISRLAKKYDTQQNGTAKNKQLKGMQTVGNITKDLKQYSNVTVGMTTMSDYNCEIKEDAREDQESDSVNSTRQPLSGSQSYRGGQRQTSKGNLPSFRGIQTLIEQQIKGKNKHYQLANHQGSSQVLSSYQNTNKDQQTNTENSYQYYFCQNPRLSQKKQRSPLTKQESPLMFVPFEARERKTQQTIINPKRSLTPSESKISQMKYFNSKRALQSNHMQNSDRSNSGVLQATFTTTAKTARELDMTNWNNSFSRNTHNMNNNINYTMESSSKGNINKNKCYFIQTKGQSHGYLKPKLDNFLVYQKSNGRNEEDKGNDLFVEVQHLKVQRNHAEKENKVRKEKITNLEKEIKQMKKQLRSWGIKDDTLEQGYQMQEYEQNGYRTQNEQFKQLQLRDEWIDKIYEDPNFYELSFKKKVKEMDGVINGLDETIKVQKDMIKKIELESTDLNKFEISLAEGYFNLLEAQIEYSSNNGIDNNYDGRTVSSQVSRKESDTYKQYQYELDRMKNSIETLKKEIQIRQETNIAFVKQSERIMNDKITRDIQIQEMRPKVERLIKIFQEIQASRTQKWNRQKQQDQYDGRGQEYDTIRIDLDNKEGGNAQEKEMSRNREKGGEKNNCQQDDQKSDRLKQQQQKQEDRQQQQKKQQQEQQDRLNITQQNNKKTIKKLDRFSYINNFTQSNNLIREKYRERQQIDQIHRQSVELNELKLQYQVFRGAQILRQQQSQRIVKKLQQEIQILREANMKIFDSIVKKQKTFIYLEKEKVKNREQQEQTEQRNEKEIKQIEDNKGEIFNEKNERNYMKDQQFSMIQSQQQQEQQQSPLKIIKQQQQQLKRQEQYQMEISKRSDISEGNIKIEDENISQISWDSLNAICGDRCQFEETND